MATAGTLTSRWLCFTFQDQRGREAAHQSPEGDHLVSVRGIPVSWGRSHSDASLWVLLLYSFHFSQLHVMDETYVINQVKEDVCYVSQQFYKDMEIAQ